MKATVYKANWKRIGKKSFLPLLPFLVQIGFNIYFSYQSKLSLGETVYLNALWGFLISFPGLLLFTNYLRHSLNTTITLKKDSICFENKKVSIELINAEIEHIKIHTIRANNRFPWGFLDFYVFQEGSKAFMFNNFTLDISELWQNSLSIKINQDRIQYKFSWFPWMRKSAKNQQIGPKY
jgi:hypothetical protein